jgi:hypothetical protein
MNRRTLIETMEDGVDVVFHVQVPTFYAYEIEQRFVIDEAIGSLIIKGHRYESTNLGWFNFVAVPRQVTLQCLGNLKNLQDLRQKGRVRTYVNFWGTAAMSPLALLVFPPLLSRRVLLTRQPSLGARQAGLLSLGYYY